MEKGRICVYIFILRLSLWLCRLFNFPVLSVLTLPVWVLYSDGNLQMCPFLVKLCNTSESLHFRKSGAITRRRIHHVLVNIVWMDISPKAKQQQQAILRTKYLVTINGTMRLVSPPSEYAEMVLMTARCEPSRVHVACHTVWSSSINRAIASVSDGVRGCAMSSRRQREDGPKRRGFRQGAGTSVLRSGVSFYSSVTVTDTVYVAQTTVT